MIPQPADFWIPSALVSFFHARTKWQSAQTCVKHGYAVDVISQITGRLDGPRDLIHPRISGPHASTSYLGDAVRVHSSSSSGTTLDGAVWTLKTRCKICGHARRKKKCTWFPSCSLFARGIRSKMSIEPHAMCALSDAPKYARIRRGLWRSLLFYGTSISVCSLTGVYIVVSSFRSFAMPKAKPRERIEGGWGGVGERGASTASGGSQIKSTLLLQMNWNVW